MNAVVLGATRGMGRALARALAERGDRLVLLGRDTEVLARMAMDLQVRGGSHTVEVLECDLSDPSGFTDVLERAERLLGRMDAVIVTAGVYYPQEDLERRPDLVENLLHVDFSGTILFCEEARRRLLAAGGGVLCVFSSVAGERARKPVVLYGAAKAGLTYYLEGLDHRFRSQGLKTVCIKPGFVATGMTDGLPAPPFARTPEQVVGGILRAIDRGKPVAYVPWIWRYVIMVVRLLPRCVMRRVGF